VGTAASDQRQAGIIKLQPLLPTGILFFNPVAITALFSSGGHLCEPKGENLPLAFKGHWK
jgi:hypothetical protein